MGMIFHVQQANLVAYLTTSTGRPPRTSYAELNAFLCLLSGGGEPSTQHLFSSSTEWIASVHGAATRARDDLVKQAPVVCWADQPVPGEEVITRLAVLRTLLNHYNLFGLAAGSWSDDQQLRAFTTYAAVDSRQHALFLIPMGWDARYPVRLRDPFPAIALAAERSNEWPGMVFWSRSGVAAFAPLTEAKDLYHELRPAMASQRQMDLILEKWSRRGTKASLLQLSDLHFGNDWAQEKEPYVSTRLHQISASIGRVVITGDLFDEPRKEQARAFHSFRTALERERGQEALVIPGNHDQKWRGMLASDLREIGKVEWSSVVIDDQMSCVFFCFDSSRDADGARGKITTEQRIQVATQFDKLSLRRPEIREYLRVALIHHHPFSFETAKETFVSRLLEQMGLTDEYFLRMDDAGTFLNWCANRGVSLILHGHKHVPRYREEVIPRADGAFHLIATVGCGTSLGAEGKPLSYNVIDWHPRSRRWRVSYFMDPGDGSAFTQEYLSADSVAEKSNL